MYRLLRDSLLRLLRVPLDPPEAPAGSPESLRVFRASPRYLTYRLVLLALFVAALGIPLSVGLVAALVKDEYGAVGALGTMGVLLLAGAWIFYFCIRIDYELRYYIVTDRAMRLREGALLVTEETLTYANVQNLHVVRGPIQKLLAISDLRIDTAGGGGGKAEGAGGGHTASFAGIDNAHEVRDIVLAYLKEQGGSGLGDLDDPEDGGATGSEVVEAARELLTSVTALRESASA